MTAKVIDLKTGKSPKARRRRPEDKWTAPLIRLGFCTIPSILMWGQGRLNLSSEEFNIVLHFADMWWDADKAPHPAKDLLARRMGISGRQVQRHLTSLEQKGIVKRVPRYRGHRLQTSNGYSMEPLVKKLAKLEPDFRKEKDQRRLRQKRLESKSA